MNSLVRVFVSQKITVPADGSISDFTVKFGAPLRPDDGKTLVSVTSTPNFTLGGETLSIKDEPGLDSVTRSVYTCRRNSNGTEQRVSQIGQINLATGVMQLSNLFTDNTTELCFIANTQSNDIVGKRNLLLSVDFDKSTFSAFPDEIARGGGSRSVDYQTFNKDRGSTFIDTDSSSSSSGGTTY